MPYNIRTSATYQARVFARDMVTWHFGSRLDDVDAIMRLFGRVTTAATDAYIDAYRDVMANGVPAENSYEVERSLAILSPGAGTRSRARTVAYGAAREAAERTAAAAVAYEALAA